MAHQSLGDALSPQSSATTSSASSISGEVSRMPPPAPLLVRAVYDYKAKERSTLSFSAGTIIRVLQQQESGWWDGYIDGRRGWFPCNFVVPLNSSRLLFDDDDEVEEFLDDDAWDEDVETGESAISADVDDVLLQGQGWDERGRANYPPQLRNEGRTSDPFDDWDSEDEDLALSSADSETSGSILMLGPTQRDIDPPEFDVFLSISH
jgi:SH3 domain